MNKNVMNYIDDNPELTEREVRALLEEEYKYITQKAIENRIKDLKSNRGSFISRCKEFLFEITHIQIEF